MSKEQASLVTVAVCVVALVAVVYLGVTVLMSRGVGPNVEQVEITNRDGRTVECAYSAIVPALDCDWGHAR